MNRIYKNQTKLIIELDPQSSLEGVSEAKIKYIKPDGTTGDWIGTIAEDIVTYQIESADTLDMVGPWVVWLFLTFNDGLTMPGDPAQMVVYEEGKLI